MRVEETWNRDFHYDAVNSQIGDVRLLTILPKSIVGSSPKLACFLENANLNAAPRYIAVSYTWGSPHNTSTILVNGVDFTVTVNLATLLQHLQHEIEEVTVWADAICIKQWDYEEKGLQIAQMLRVYQTARSTYIWLGPAEDGSNEAMAAILKTSQDKKLHQLADRPVMTREMQAAAMIYEFGPRLARHFNKKSPKDSSQTSMEEDPAQEAFVKLMNRYYWSRVWCLQEIVVSGNARISCGSYTMDAELFSIAARARSKNIALSTMDLSGRISIETQGYAAAKPILEHTMAARMIQQRHRYINSTALGEDNEGFLKLAHLLSVLYVDSGIGSTSPLQSGDPRDRIYGMLGMAEDTEALGIVPNYTITWEQAYTDVMFKLLRAGYSNTLLLCQNRSEQPGSLPSWVPNFQQPLRQPPSQPPSLRNPFNACGFSQNMGVGHIEGSTMLRMRGIAVSTVATVKDVGKFADTELWEASFQEIKAFLENVAAVVAESSKRHDADAVARVAVGDMEFDSEKDKWRRATAKTHEWYRLSGPALRGIVGGKEAYEKRRDTVARLKKNLPAPVKFGGIASALAGGATTMSLVLPRVGPYLTAVMRMAGRRPFVSADGRVGLGPGDMQVGDTVVIFDGVDVPFILRRLGGQQEAYRLIGEAYVHGAMDGELGNESTPKQLFDLL